MINPGLERITRLLTHLPCQNYPTIHVAGTNGKGSVCAYLTALFQNHANTTTSSPFQRIGRFNSPHLITPGDSITINNIPVASFARVSQHIALIDERENIGASDFELLTATAFTAFAEEKVSLGIVECGMGGRLDATNVLVRPIVTVITRLGFDHQAFLGSTPEAIAMEKSGIMRKDVPCVVDSTSTADFIAEIKRQAASKGTHITLTRSTPPDQSDEFQSTINHLDKRTIDTLHELPETTVSNMWTAYLTYKHALSHFSLPLPLGTSIPALFNAMMQTPNPGRYQKLSLQRLTGRIKPIILDGAHNTQAFAALVQQVSRIRGGDGTTPVTWVLASTDSRDPRELLALIPAQDRIVATTFTPVQDMPWVRPFAVQQWRDILKGKREVWRVDEAAEAALSTAVKLAGEEPLVVAGSLYLVADVLRAV